MRGLVYIAHGVSVLPRGARTLPWTARVSGRRNITENMTSALTTDNLRTHHAEPARDDDNDSNSSLATSDHCYESTRHFRKRLLQRDISVKEIQSVLKHGRCEQVRDGAHLFRHDGLVVVTDVKTKAVITTWRDQGATPLAACWPADAEAKLGLLENCLGDSVMQMARAAVAACLSCSSAATDLDDDGVFSATDALLKQRARRLTARFAVQPSAEHSIRAVMAAVVAVVARSPADPMDAYFSGEGVDTATDEEAKWLLPSIEVLRPVARAADPEAAARACEAAAAEALIIGDSFVEMSLLPFDAATALSLLRASMALRTWAPTDDCDENKTGWSALLFRYACLRMRPALTTTFSTTEAAASALAASIFTEAESAGTASAFDVAFQTALDARVSALTDPEARAGLAEATCLFRHTLTLQPSSEMLRGCICFKLGQLCAIRAAQHFDGSRSWVQTENMPCGYPYRLATVGYQMERVEDWVQTARARMAKAKQWHRKLDKHHPTKKARLGGDDARRIHAPAGAIFFAHAGATIPGGAGGGFPLAPGHRKRMRVDDPAEPSHRKRARVDEPAAQEREASSSDPAALACPGPSSSNQRRLQRRQEARRQEASAREQEQEAGASAASFEGGEYSARVGLAVGSEGEVRLVVCSFPSRLSSSPPPPPPGTWTKVPSECGCAGAQCRACNTWRCPYCNGKKLHQLPGGIGLQGHLQSDGHRKREAAWLAKGGSAVQLPLELLSLLSAEEETAAANRAKAALKASRRQAEEEAAAAKAARLKAAAARGAPPPPPPPQQPTFGAYFERSHILPPPPPPLSWPQPRGGQTRPYHAQPAPLLYARPPPPLCAQLPLPIYAPPPLPMTAWTYHNPPPHRHPPPRLSPFAHALAQASPLNPNTRGFVPGSWMGGNV